VVHAVGLVGAGIGLGAQDTASAPRYNINIHYIYINKCVSKIRKDLKCHRTIYINRFVSGNFFDWNNLTDMSGLSCNVYSRI
jgi:hypothetical protein